MGIGRAVATACAGQGAEVIIADNDREAGEKAAAGIREKGAKALAIEMDVSEYSAVERAAQALKDRGVRADVLVNNAAVWNIAPFIETVPDDWRRELAVSLFGVLNCCRVFLPAMIERGSGVIINIASDAGRIGEPSWSVYSAAKGGVIAFTKALAKEAGKSGIRVNAVSPGITRTEKVRAFITNQEKMVRSYPLGRLGEPEDIAGAVVFLASDEASFVTGQVLSVSGGYSMAG